MGRGKGEKLGKWGEKKKRITFSFLYFRLIIRKKIQQDINQIK